MFEHGMRVKDKDNGDLGTVSSARGDSVCVDWDPAKEGYAPHRPPQQEELTGADAQARLVIVNN